MTSKKKSGGAGSGRRGTSRLDLDIEAFQRDGGSVATPSPEAAALRQVSVWQEADEEAARATGHPVGCDCTTCALVRAEAARAIAAGGNTGAAPIARDPSTDVHHHAVARRSDYQQGPRDTSWFDHCACGADRLVERTPAGTFPGSWSRP